MYLHRCCREKEGKRHAYWALVESYRTVRGPRQRVVGWRGAMNEAGRIRVRRCAAGEDSETADLFVSRGEPGRVVEMVRPERCPVEAGKTA
jgi:hypothetical protein